MKYYVLANRVRIGEIETDECMDDEIFYRPGRGATIEFERNAQDELLVLFMRTFDGDEYRAKACLNIVVETMGERKISVIKFVRAMTSKGLKESKELVDALIEQRKNKGYFL